MNNNVIVIGAGCAGMIAALQAQAAGAEVVIMDRGAIGLGTNSAWSAGKFSAPNTHYHPEEHMRNTLETGHGINYEVMVRAIVEEAPHAFSLIRALGVELEETSQGYAVKTSRPGLIPGIPLVKTLAGEVKNSAGIEVMTGLYVTEILKEEERVYGIKGFDKTGKLVVMYASAVVLATGGAGAIYLRNDNHKDIMGQGYYLAAKLGLALWDMEFVQFYPLVIAEPDLPSLILYPPSPQEARVVNAAGEDILRRHGIKNLNEAIMRKRDEFSVILFQECLEEPLYMDWRRVPASFWKNHPLTRIKLDFKKKLFAISPAAHFFMGGIRTDESGQTSVPGLFACGEVVWGLHGANRMGGNALTECVVLGSIAGRNAARYALHNPVSERSLKELSKDVWDLRSSTKVTLGEIRQRIRETAWIYAGVVRSEKGLKEGLAKLTMLQRQLKGIAPQTVRERAEKEDLISAAFVLKAVLTASIARKESRGSFIRKDFPQQDDLNWRKNSSLTYEWEREIFSLNHYPSG